MLTAYQYRIYPTYSQRQLLETQLDGCQTLYNQALAMRKQAYEHRGESLTYNKQAGMLTNPRHLRRAEFLLKRKQRIVSRRKKTSHRRKKCVYELAKQHEHIVNQRKDFHGKTAHRLYARYDAVVVENLQITNMVKNHHLAKSISDAAWGNFILTLASKAENAGLHLLKVPPHGTSQKCSGCQQVVKKSLATRIHRCDCGLVIDRDHNAAINILRVASTLRGGALVVISPEKLSKGRKKRKIRKPYDGGSLQAPSFRAG